MAYRRNSLEAYLPEEASETVVFGSW